MLVVDQCEEAVALCDDAAEQARFFAALAAHAEEATLVVALRADRMAEVSRHAPFARLVERGLYLLTAMDATDLRAAIEGPAHQAGVLLEPGLVDLLVRDVEGEPGALPLLSHALRKTWEGREGRTLTVAGYRQTGGIRAAVAQSAEEVYAQRPRRSARSCATSCCAWSRRAPTVSRYASACLGVRSPAIPSTKNSWNCSWAPGW